MQQVPPNFPHPALAVDSGLEVVYFSRPALAVFGIRARGGEEEMRQALQGALAADAELDAQLALATARLARPGESETFAWSHRERRYEVELVAAEGGGLWVFFADGTQQARAEELLSEARYHLEHILANIPSGVVVLGRDLRITAVNRPQLRFLELLGFGVGLVDCIGATLEAVLPADPGAAWHALCSRVVESGRREVEGKRAFAVDGGELDLAVAATPLRDHAGRVDGAILVCDDISEQTRLEKELLRVEKLATVGQMVITINHEINNPLSIISNNAQALRLLNPDFDEKTVRKLRSVEEQVKRIAEVTERLRSMEDVSTGEYISDGPEMIDVWRQEKTEE